MSAERDEARERLIVSARTRTPESSVLLASFRRYSDTPSLRSEGLFGWPCEIKHSNRVRVLSRRFKRWYAFSGSFSRWFSFFSGWFRGGGGPFNFGPKTRWRLDSDHLVGDIDDPVGQVRKNIEVLKSTSVKLPPITYIVMLCQYIHNIIYMAMKVACKTATMHAFIQPKSPYIRHFVIALT